MSASFSVSFDIRKAKWLEDEAKRLNIKRSQIIRELIDSGVQYLNKKDSTGYAEINFLESTDEEITHLMERCARVLEQRRREKESLSTISTSNNDTLEKGQIAS
ncbi:MAG: hypothetical protein JRN15_04135 [Nitrososphaerota archaeon]|nr:hypothetical protein [Nitrososphaerota archaeon]